MPLYPSSKLIRANLFAFQGASFKQAGQPVKASNAERGKICLSEAAIKLTSFFVALHSGMGYTLNRRSSNQNNFIRFNDEARV